MVALHKVFSYSFSPGLAIERFDDEAILFVADRDALITVNRGGADLFEVAYNAFVDRSFGREDAVAWFEDTFDLPAEEVTPKLVPLLAFAVRHGIVLKSCGA